MDFENKSGYNFENNTYDPIIFFYVYKNDLHNIQITTDKHNHQIP